MEASVAPRPVSQTAAGFIIAICTVWLAFALLAPLVAEAAKERRMARPTAPCPMGRVVMHGVGSDLRSYQVEFDRCATAGAWSK